MNSKMTCRRSSFRNSSTTGLIVKRSAAAPKPTEVAATAEATLSLLPHSQSTKFTQRSHSRGGNYGNDHHHNIHRAAEPIIEFPVSPDADVLLLGEGITNSNHPQHKMVHVNLPNPFTCMGCKEYGAGSRFTCQQCNFELHDFCALAPLVLKAHPLHSQHQLVFIPKPGKGGLMRSKCDVCGKSAKGYMFHCSACSFQLHPCCAMLSAKMSFPTHPHSLIILPATANLASPGDHMLCSECKKRRAGKLYQCTVCDYYLHAVCAKSMVNGLHANGIKGLENGKPSMLGVAAKIASHVVVGLMGGIVEGIGEGLGEALTQNFLKGRCNSTRISRISE
ncbi:protein VACUOLELESS GAMETOPHYTES [Beta vulgaris subsp. vulgaris]|uniref:protein VACUOLELESS GAMETOPHYTES n=1 Tax=Beta vulgaris subsp. vulgaris TaxID=3555 RepID=UPI0020373903|nr:protein VACUOLELESS GAMETOPHYTES [Beta vulgaris subsp. vulgaris]